MGAFLEVEPLPILPPKEEGAGPVGKSVYLPRSLWDRLQTIAEESKREDPDGKGYSRNEVIIHFLKWACDEHEREVSERRPARKR